MNSYNLAVHTSFGTVTVESCDFDYIKDVKEALDTVQAKADKAETEQMNTLVNRLFDAEVKKLPAKKRGRPVGSRNKAKKAK